MADKGIRVNVNHKFVELMPQRAELGNTRFRAEVIGYAMESFDISLASAATHYNHAFKEAKKVPELLAQLEGLGRADDKKGGRKPKVAAVAAVEGEVVVPEQTVFTVCKKADGTVVAENMSFEDATALVARAKAAKKATLYWK